MSSRGDYLLRYQVLHDYDAVIARHHILMPGHDFVEASNVILESDREEMADSIFLNVFFDFRLLENLIQGVSQEVPGAFEPLLIVSLVGHPGVNPVGLTEDLRALQRSFIDGVFHTLPIFRDFRANNEQNAVSCGWEGPLGVF